MDMDAPIPPSFPGPDAITVTAVHNALTNKALSNRINAPAGGFRAYQTNTNEEDSYKNWLASAVPIVPNQ